MPLAAGLDPLASVLDLADGEARRLQKGAEQDAVLRLVLHPAAFRFMAPANPGVSLRAAELIGADIAGAGLDDAGEVLARAVVDLMNGLGMPNGLGAVGFTPDDFRRMFLDSMTIW